MGACGSAPMMQVSNGPYAYNLTPEKIDAVLAAMEAGKPLPFVSVTLPQDEDEMDGNRRTDAEAVEHYAAPPKAKRTQ